jgi:hypothetical protein
MAASTLGVSTRLSACARLIRSLLATGLICNAACAAERRGTPAIVLAPTPTPQSCFEVRGLPAAIATELRQLPPRDARWAQVFNIHVAAGASGDQPPILGTYEATGDGVRFRPRYPLQRGLQYRAVFDWPPSGGLRNSSAATSSRLHQAEILVVPLSRTGPPARVVAIYPSGRELPENLLRIYVQFSAPMSQGNCYRRLHLHDDTTGTDVEQPFLELPQELWSPDGTRLTLLFEPGRVKHGLVPREELGPVLVPGRNYTLTVDASWPDADGRPLGAAGSKTFRAVQADARQLDLHAWTIQSPHEGTREPLAVRFPKPLDRGMLDRVLRVLRASGPNATPAATEIAGTVRVANDETLWTFEPSEPWIAGQYVLAVSTQLEDPAGNSVGQSFEVDMKKPRTAGPRSTDARIDFEVRARPK